MLKKKLGVENLEVVDCEGKGGGLVVLWRRGISVVLKGKSKNHIDVEVLETGGQKMVVYWDLWRTRVEV